MIYKYKSSPHWLQQQQEQHEVVFFVFIKKNIVVLLTEGKTQVLIFVMALVSNVYTPYWTMPGPHTIEGRRITLHIKSFFRMLHSVNVDQE